MSKRLILIFLLTLLVSACAQQVTPVPSTSENVQTMEPVPSNTAEPTRSVIAAWTELAFTKGATIRPTATETSTTVESATAAFSVCPGAPGPYPLLDGRSPL